MQLVYASIIEIHHHTLNMIWHVQIYIYLS